MIHYINRIMSKFDWKGSALVFITMACLLTYISFKDETMIATKYILFVITISFLSGFFSYLYKLEKETETESKIITLINIFRCLGGVFIIFLFILFDFMGAFNRNISSPIDDLDSQTLNILDVSSSTEIPVDANLTIKRIKGDGLTEQNSDTYFTRTIVQDTDSVLAIELDKSLPSSKEINELNVAAEAADWVHFIDISTKILSVDHALGAITLASAIENSAPIEVISELIDNGAQLDFIVLVSLIRKADIDYLQGFISLGLNIHMESSVGENGLTYASKILSTKMFNFLLSNGVSVKPSSLGYDPLDFILKNAAKGRNITIFAQKLLEYGAPIELSHLRFLTELREKDYNNFIELTKKVPELDLIG